MPASMLRATIAVAVDWSTWEPKVMVPRTRRELSNPVSANEPAAAGGQPSLKRHTRGLGERGRAAQGDLVARKEREQVRDVAVTGFGFVVVFEQIGRAQRLNSSHLGISYAVFCLKK